MLRQIPRSFRIECYLCEPSDGFNKPFDFSELSAQLLDANGVLLRYQPDTAKLAGASVSSSDTTIVDYVDGQWRSRFKEGDTWLMRQQFGQTDSLLWTERQVFAPRMTCPDSAAVSDTVRVGITFNDAAGWPMARPVTIRWYLVFRRGNGSFSLPQPISMDGVFVPTEPAYWAVEVYGGREVVRCGVHVG